MLPMQPGSASMSGGGGGRDEGVERAAPFPLCLALDRSAGYCSLSTMGV